MNTTATRNRYPDLKTVDYNGSGYGDIEIALYRRFGSDYQPYVDTACRAVINYERGNLNQRVRVPGVTIGGRYYPGGLRDSATVVWVWNLYPFITARAVNRSRSSDRNGWTLTAGSAPAPEPFTMSGNEPTPEPGTARVTCTRCGVAMTESVDHITNPYICRGCYPEPVDPDPYRIRVNPQRFGSTDVSGYSVDPDDMPRYNASDLVDAMRARRAPEPVDQLTGLTESIQQRAMLRYHLACNHYPPVDAAWIDPCIRAIDLYNAGQAHNPVRCPDGYPGQDGTGYMRAIDIVTGLHLETWLDPEPEY